MSDPLTDDQLEQIRAELRAGRKLQAVKLYKEWTGSSLLDAKQYVEQMKARHPADFAPMASGPGDDEMDQILDALRQGRKIQAIKLYKENSGASLKDAKEFIERLADELRAIDPNAAPSTSGCGAVILLIVLLGCSLLVHAV